MTAGSFPFVHCLLTIIASESQSPFVVTIPKESFKLSNANLTPTALQFSSVQYLSSQE